MTVWLKENENRDGYFLLYPECLSYYCSKNDNKAVNRKKLKLVNPKELEKAYFVGTFNFLTFVDG